jgi:hypothetical protein
MPRSSSLPFINAQSLRACAARSQIVRSDIEALGRSPVALETGPFHLGVAGWAPDRRRNEYAIGPIGGRRWLKCHVV